MNDASHLVIPVTALQRFGAEETSLERIAGIGSKRRRVVVLRHAGRLVDPRGARIWTVPLAVWLLGGCGSGVLDPQGPIAAAERIILLNATVIMLAVVLPAIGMTLAFAWWFRASNPRARHLPEWSYSGKLEFIVWSIPAMIVLFLAGIGWIGAHDLDPRKPIASDQRPVDVQVVSLDWKWLFIYPDQGVASLNQLVVPAGTPISFQLTSATVMNSFFVPQLGSQIYTMAGMITHLNLQADRPGTLSWVLGSL